MQRLPGFKLLPHFNIINVKALAAFLFCVQPAKKPAGQE
jgi:hypothetical protein